MAAAPLGAHATAGVMLGVLTLAADQASKWWILYGLGLPLLGSVEVLPFLNLTMVWNQGVTFGMLSSDSDVAVYGLAAVALGVVAFLGLWLWRAEKRAVAMALGAICGGAIGNVIDRTRFGAVVDFLHAHAFGYSWYVFNIADAAIVCGVGVLLIDSLLPAARPASDTETR